MALHARTRVNDVDLISIPADTNGPNLTAPLLSYLSYRRPIKQLTNPIEVDLRARIMLAEASRSEYDVSEDNMTFRHSASVQPVPSAIPQVATTVTSDSAPAGTAPDAAPTQSSSSECIMRCCALCTSCVPAVTSATASHTNGKLKPATIRRGDYQVLQVAIPQLRSLLEAAAKRFKRSPKMQLTLAWFYQYLTENRHLEMTQLMQAERHSPGWDEMFVIRQRRREVRVCMDSILWSPVDRRRYICSDITMS